MTDMKDQAIAQDLTEGEDQIEDLYGVDEDLNLSSEALRRDRLAHLLLSGLRLVMEDEQNQD